MKCVIHGPNVKLFARALYSMAKLGEDLYLEAQDDGLALRCTNSARSAFMCYLFNPPFFTGYYLTSGPDSNGDKDEEHVAKCKLSMKAILMAFRSMGSLDKNVESCTILISAKLSKTKIELHCKNSVVKTYTLPFIECESIKASYSGNKGSNRFTAHAKVLTEVALNFLKNQEEVTMSVDDTRFTMKNFVENEEDSKKTVHTEMSMTPAEFEYFSVARKSTVTFCLKELRAFIGFAEAYNLPVSVCFDTSGNPIVFSIQSPETLEGVLVLATMEGDVDEPEEQNAPSTIRGTQSATNQLASCNSTQSENLPSVIPCSSQARENNDESQATLNFHSKRHISGGCRNLPSMTTSRLENLNRTAESLFGSRLDEDAIANGFVDGDDAANEMSSNIRRSDRNGGGETQTSLVFHSKRHILGGPKSKSSYNQQTDSESDCDDDRVRIGPTCDEEEPTQGTSRDVTQRDVVYGSPPSKRAKLYFQPCFDITFNPNKISGADRILAPDSDEEF